MKDKGRLIEIFWLRAADEGGTSTEPVQLGLGDGTRRAFADLPRLDDAAADQSEHRHLANGETLSRLLQRQLSAFGHLAVPVHGNAVGAAVRAHPAFGPGVALAGALPAAIKDGGNAGVRLLPGQGADQLVRFRLGRPAVLPRPVLRYRQRRMIPEGDPAIGTTGAGLLIGGAAVPTC